MKKVPKIVVNLLFLICATCMQAQMPWVVNSLEDDSKSHPFDNPNTQNIDESMDGICGDSLGRCTLRAALEEISALGIATTLSFSISGTIQKDPNQTEFEIPEHLVINGTNQQVTIRGNGNDFLFLTNDNVQIKGLVFSHAYDGIDVVGMNNIIGGNKPKDRNVFVGMSQSGIALFGNSNIVKGNFIGIDAQEMLNGNRFGIFITGEDNTVGGISNDDRNIIAGNDMGISVASFSGNTYIIGNFIGTDSDGSHAKPNNIGINIIGANTTVGGITIQEANLIAGNHESGILVGAQSTNVAILGNVIGKQGSGIGAPNRDGIVLGPGSFGSQVEMNHIEGNTNFGIHIAGLAGELESFSHRIGDNEITQNRVGIMIQGNATENTIGSPRTFDFKSNEINFNQSQGVVFSMGEDGTLPRKNTVRKNKFKENGNDGILIATGQDGIEKPVVDSFQNLGVNATVSGTHPRAGSVIDIYTGVKNMSNVYEGYAWLGKGVVGLDHTFHFSVTQSHQDIIVATATDPDGNTSEFSDATEVEGPVPVIQPPGQTSIPPPPPPPFQDGPVIRFEVSTPGYVDLKIYDLTGHPLETIFREFALPGEYDQIWNLKNYPAGIYLFKLLEGNGPGIIGKLISVQY